MADTASNQEREMRVAVERVVGFAQEFGEAHLNLACHAAFPLSLTPDLLYQIWANFVPEAPWTAVARVLLSRLCKQVGAEMYEMDNSVRNLLLRELKVQFGQERFELLSEFLLEYIGQRLTEEDPDTQDLREAQEWTFLAYTKPEQAARKLAEVLSSKVQEKDIGEVFRLNDMLETLAEPLVEAGFEPLLVYGRGMKSYVCGDLESAQNKLYGIQLGNKKNNFIELNLHIPQVLSPINIKNTCEPANPDPDGTLRWDWTIYLDANQQTLSKIEYVEYTLHKTFRNRIKTTSNSQNNFALKSNGWGEFDIKVKVFFKDGKIRNLSHWLQLRNCQEKVESFKIDYTNLKKILAEGKWKEADKETARIIFKIAKREQERWLRPEDIDNLSSFDLINIDQLWVKHSNGHFGFSIQKQIYQSLGGTKEYNQKITQQFWKALGWISDYQPYWSQYENLNFTLSVPQGNLPIKYHIEAPHGVYGVIESLLSRQDLGLPNQLFEENRDKIINFILEELFIEEYELELDIHPRDDIAVGGINKVTLASREPIQVRIIDHEVGGFEENILRLNLELELEFSIEVSCDDFDNYIPAINDDVPSSEIIFPKHFSKGSVVVAFWVSDDFSEAEFESLEELNIKQPIKFNN